MNTTRLPLPTLSNVLRGGLLGLLVGMLGLLLAGCGTPTSSPIVGAWERHRTAPAGAVGERSVTFKDDFTFDFFSGNSGRWSAAIDGIFSARDGGGRTLVFYQNSPLALYCLGDIDTAQPVANSLTQGYSLAVLEAKGEVPFLIEYRRASGKL